MHQQPGDNFNVVCATHLVQSWPCGQFAPHFGGCGGYGGTVGLRNGNDGDRRHLWRIIMAVEGLLGRWSGDLAPFVGCRRRFGSIVSFFGGASAAKTADVCRFLVAIALDAGDAIVGRAGGALEGV